MKPSVKTLVAITTLCSGFVFAQPNQIPTIQFDAKQRYHEVSPLLFGANHKWVSNAAGSADSITGLSYPNFVEQIKDVGVTMIRYPAGIFGNLFQWERAIGPQAKRGLQISGLMTMPIPYKSTFGPNEYGALLDQTGAMGNLMINCATATAADAANFVAYMTAPSGSAKVNNVDWASRRAADGHPAPYKIEYVEIGNEYDPSIQPLIDQNYWIKGEVVDENYSNQAEKISHLYAFGGMTKFNNQPVVQQTDWRANTSISNGLANQIFYARYAPVLEESDAISVDGVVWKPVAKISRAKKNGLSYSLDHKTGKISFGDGKHGAIPKQGAKITVSYVSGPHEGFVDFYKAIKAVNPRVKIISSIHNENFIRFMGSAYPYDGIQQHPYVIANPKTNTAVDLNDFFIQTAIATIKLGAQVQHTQTVLKKYFGPKAGNIHLLLSEYGQLGVFPDYAPHFARSQGQAVLQAICMREWVLRKINAADRTVLTDYTFKPIPADLAAVQFPDAGTAGDFAIFGGPGPNTIITPVGLAMKLMKDNLGQTLIGSSILNSPTVTSAKGETSESLLAFSTSDSKNNVYLIVTNIDPVNDISAKIVPTNFDGALKIMVSVLASPGINDENNPENPTKVFIAKSEKTVSGGELVLSFPKHSITAVKFSSKE